MSETITKIHVRLRPDWKGNFRRTIKRDEKGKSLEVRVFTAGEVIEIPPAELPYLADDLGKALQPMEWSNEFNKYRPLDLSEIDLPEMIKQIKGEAEAEEPVKAKSKKAPADAANAG